MSIQTRLNIIAGLLLFIVLVALTVALLVQAGPRVHAENESIMHLTHDLVSRSLHALKDSPAPEKSVKQLVGRLRSLRHVRVTWRPAGAAPGTIVDNNRDKRAGLSLLERLILPDPPPDIIIPVLQGKAAIGEISIAANPSDELSEVISAIGWILLGGSALAIALFAVTSRVIARALKPLLKLERAIARLEDGRYDLSIESEGPPEIRTIGTKLTHLASSLKQADAENLRLSQRLVTIQDDERREIARDLHDELGPHLFAARASGTMIKAAFEKPNSCVGKPGEKIDKLLDQIDCLQQANRRVLQKLAPVGLRELGLCAAIKGLADNWKSSHPNAVVSLSLDPEIDGLDAPTTLTVYRVVQEGLTNAFRHADPSRVLVNVGPDASGAQRPAPNESESTGAVSPAHRQRNARILSIEVQDNGRGLKGEPPFGFGLTGMRERITALGGTLALVPINDGTSLRALLPRRVKE